MLSAEATAAIIMAARKEFKKKFPCFISPSNRADLIARTVSHLGRFGDIHLQQRDTIRVLQKKLDAINAAKEESLASLQHIEEMNAMNGTTMNMNSDGVGVGIGGSTNPESSMSDVTTSQQQQQQMPVRSSFCFTPTRVCILRVPLYSRAQGIFFLFHFTYTFFNLCSVLCAILFFLCSIPFVHR